ncbi:MAG: penicillin-insensitive murein endopeptidase [Betaproteobacteria bacterium]
MILLLCALPAHGETNEAEEAQYRAQALRTLPRDAARRLFAVPATPAQLPAQAIGAYGKGCVAGAVELAPQGPGWQVMRLSRARNFGHPKLVAWIQALAAGALADGWPGLLIGDMAQPRGGPMLTGHSSHQLGLEADIWLTPAPVERQLTMQERENMPTTDLVQPDLLAVNAAFTPAHAALLRRAALMPEVERIFVNAAIKQAACQGATGERGWLRKLRPWPGHTEHFHVALKCPDAGCAERNPVPSGDGCGKELAHWLREDVRFPKRDSPPPKILKLNDLPRACRQVLAAP